MNDRLEDFVKQNKKQFEHDGPSDALWRRLESDLAQQPKAKKSFILYQWMSIAAMLIVCIGGYFVYQQKPANSDMLKVADVNPTVGKKAVQFVNSIEEKKDSLAVFATKNPDLYREFSHDIIQLDADYQKMKKALQTSPNKEQIIKAMVKNLELQSQVLSQQLNIIHQVNEIKQENVI